VKSSFRIVWFIVMYFILLYCFQFLFSFVSFRFFFLNLEQIQLIDFARKYGESD
jgi:hypothetical protein